jgi:hypothetical protein
MNSLPAWQIAGFIALHFGAITCALGTRIAAGSRYEALFQFLFLPSLAAIGLATWYCHSESLGIGIPSGITFMSMVLLAVTDFRRVHDPAAHHFGLHR